MDNTLFDLVGAQAAACHQVVRHLGYDDGDELFRYFLSGRYGFESTENIRQYMADRSIPADSLYHEACRIYADEKLRQIVPYPGVEETVKAVRALGLPMIIVTDAEAPDARMRLDKSGLSSYFDRTISFDLVKEKKPAPAPFLAALDATGTAPYETLFIGDSLRRDIAPCKKLGIRTVYARYGDRFSGTRQEIEADFVIDCMDDLLGIIGSP
jgi:putative hydrolase of the HAD superfamily